jgi:hypothetical protein
MSAAATSRNQWVRRAGVIGGLVLFMGVSTASTAWYSIYRDPGKEHYEDIEDLFKYGSMGNEEYQGIPYWIWRAFPEVFPDLLPQNGKPGYASFGFLYEEGNDMPLGLTRRRIGFDRVGTNCAMCHITHVRETEQSDTLLYLSGTNTSFDGQAYFSFMFEAVNDPRFNADTLMSWINANSDLSLRERALYRYVLIPRARDELLAMQRRLNWWYDIPAPGPGRWIAFNDLKFHFAKLPRDGSIGNPDVPALWNMQPRQDTEMLHWDGFSDDIHKTAQSATVGAGAREHTIPRDDLNRLVEWWLVQPAPAYPFAIDRALAAQGQPVFAQHCASCHEIGNPTANRIIPIDEIGTDRHRFDLITPELPDAYNRHTREAYGWTEPQVRKMEGYASGFLDAIWARAPYLHNGSVPTLADLLEPPALRPVEFYRGYNVYDQERMGFVWSGPAAERDGTLYDTRLPGNGNMGHLYGTDLPPEQKRALVEYLKTL